MVLHTVQECIFCGVFAPTVACFDAMRYTRRTIIIGQSCVLVVLGMYVVVGRCSSKEFPEDLMVCKPQLMTFREISAALVFQSIIFVSKNLFAKLGGSVFGAIHPTYIPSSQAHYKLQQHVINYRASSYPHHTNLMIFGFSFFPISGFLDMRKLFPGTFQYFKFDILKSLYF